MVKVGLIAHPMQNSMRNMTGTLFLMCGGLMMSKLRILDGPPKLGFQSGGNSGLAGNSDRRYDFPEIPEILYLNMLWLKIVAELSEWCPEQC